MRSLSLKQLFFIISQSKWNVTLLLAIPDLDQESGERLSYMLNLPHVDQQNLGSLDKSEESGEDDEMGVTTAFQASAYHAFSERLLGAQSFGRNSCNF